MLGLLFFFFSSRRRHTRYIGDWSSDVCSSDLLMRQRYPPGDDSDSLTHQRKKKEEKVKELLEAYVESTAEFSAMLKERTAGETAYDHAVVAGLKSGRSEERRVGKECRSTWWP